MSDAATPLPSPPETAETARFWQAAREGMLLYGFCRACDKRHFYPRAICPFCFSTEIDWPPSCGSGKIYSFSIVRRASPPYVTAWVALADGVTVFTTVVDCDPDVLVIGMPVELVFRSSTDGHAIPVFRCA